MPSPSSGAGPCFVLFREESTLSFHLFLLFFNLGSHLISSLRSPSSCLASIPSIRSSVPIALVSSGVTENSKPLAFFIANSGGAEFILFPFSVMSSLFSPLFSSTKNPHVWGPLLPSRDPGAQCWQAQIEGPFPRPILVSGAQLAEVPEPGRSERAVTPAAPSRTKALADPTPITRKALPEAQNPYCQPPSLPNRR